MAGKTAWLSVVDARHDELLAGLPEATLALVEHVHTLLHPVPDQWERMRRPLDLVEPVEGVPAVFSR